MSKSDLVISKHLVIPSAELVTQVSASGGPGGQHANKTSTKVTLRWNLSDSRVISETQRDRLKLQLAHRLTQSGELIVHSSESRSQKLNDEAARKRLARWIKEALIVPKKRKATKPTRSSNERRLKRKKRHSDLKKARQKKQFD
ncbi:MAG: alternative ribosome rescue aminoacyl-tRNA hydrolase ArfB [Myxococcota bacterium]|nr:alternative ribosome rescue aminoacyl-tRNA hydrolase ArfB [Myxococcota bacterium]